MYKIKISPIDEEEYIVSAARSNMLLVEDCRERNDVKGVMELFRGTQKLLEGYDRDMMNLCLQANDDLALIRWANRVASILRKIRLIESILPMLHKNSPFWIPAAQSIGLLVAYRMGTEQTLNLNREPVDR